MRGQRIKAKLRADQPVFTTGLRFHAPRLVEMLARSGADQIFLDAEHGPDRAPRRAPAPRGARARRRAAAGPCPPGRLIPRRR
jgi:2-keto-3-deoxy-L-rhamnonate aldolase RhmA